MQKTKQLGYKLGAMPKVHLRPVDGAKKAYCGQTKNIVSRVTEENEDFICKTCMSFLREATPKYYEQKRNEVKRGIA